jgi:predicted outer membrane protein
MKHVVNALLLVGMLWTAGAAQAQGQGQSQTRGKTMDFRGMTVSTEPKQFVERLLYLQEEVVDEAQRAQRSSQSPEVKELAATLVKTHQGFDERLKQAMKDQKLKPGTFQAKTNEERSTVAAEKSTEEKLKALSGDAFDQAFLAAQVNDHDRLLLSVMAGQQLFNGQPLGTVLAEMQPELLRLRERAYQLLGQQAATLGTGGAGTGDMQKDSGKK